MWETLKQGLMDNRIDPAFLRPADVDHLFGDASMGMRVLGWMPSVTFEQLVALMVEADLARLSPSARAGLAR